MGVSHTAQPVYHIPIPQHPLREQLLSYSLVLALVLSALLSALPAAAAPVAATPQRATQEAIAACTRITGEAQVPSQTVLHFDELANAFTLGTHYQAAHGVVFEDNQTTRAITYSDNPNDVGKSFSKPNIATNSAQPPNTSANLPMVIAFDTDQAYVGLRPGNGKDSAGNGPDIGAILRAYDRAGNLLCTETLSPVPASHPVFFGVYDSAARIARVELDYGNTLLSESIDNLTFSGDKNPPIQPGSCVELFHENQIPSRVLVNFDDLADAVAIGEHYVPAHGLHFMDATNTRVITYGDRSVDPTTARSAPNVATNDAVSPSTSANVPLTFWFDSPKAHVGFYMGNGETQNLPGAMVGYDAAGNVICQVTNSPVPEAYTEFIGMYDSAGRIARVTLNYGNTTLSEAIDDLYFSGDKSAPIEPTEPTPPSYDPPTRPIVNRDEFVRIQLGQNDDKGLQGAFQFPEAHFWKVQGPERTEFGQVGVPGIDQAGMRPGLPNVPIYTRLIAVPVGATLMLDKSTPKVRQLNSVLLAPVQPEAADTANSQEEDPFPKDDFRDRPFAFDKEAYASGKIFPEKPVEINRLGVMRDLELWQISVAAGQYDTGKQVLRLFESIDISLHFEGGKNYFRTERDLNPFNKQMTGIEGLVLNYAILDKFILPGDITQWICIGTEYLIITDPAFRTAADTLADWKRTSGISTLVVETGAGKAGVTKEEIQAYIRSKYDTCLVRPSYVDLIGDAEHIPPFYRATAYSAAAGTDLDYSLMDNADIIPDLALGRIPVDTLAEAEAVVNKIVAYEQHPPLFILPNASYYNTMTFASYFQCCKDGASSGTDERAYVETSEFVRDELTSQYTVERIYTTNAGASDTPNYYYNGAPLPAALNAASGYAWDGDTTDIIDAFNAGRMLVYHRDHGSSSGWSSPSFKASNLASLTNGSRTPVVYSINCSTGYFDNETDGSGASGSYFAEQILRLAEGGAAGVFAASRVSPTWANNALTRGLFDATWTDVVPGYGSGTSITRLGDILNYGKAYMVSQIGVAQTAGSVSTGASDTNLIIYHLFGDATMEMHTGNPYSIVLPFEAIPERVGPKLWNLKYPVDGAVITALQDGKPLARGTVEKGIASLRFLGDRDPDRPVQFSADMPGAIPVKLRVKQSSGEVTPEQGGTVENEKKDFSIEFPPNAVDENVEIVHTELVSPTVDVPAGKTPLRSFLLDASDGEGNEIRQFKDFYVMKLCFSDEELKELGDLSKLELVFFDEEKQAWVAVESKVDESGKCLLIKLDHFTEFAVLGDAEPTAPTMQLFLPAVQR